MEIRHATMADLSSISLVEKECFPAAGACTKETFRERIHYYGNHFWLLFDQGELISFVDGFVTNEKDLYDWMYEKAGCHDENGQWQMIFGVNTIPSRRHHGYAARLIETVIQQAKEQKRKGLVLTCKDALVPFYEQFGFVNEGISTHSVHGGVSWNQMRLVFESKDSL